MPAYYNEIDAFAAQWLRNLIEAGHIAPGHVDERSISDVTPSDVAGYTQCHFFAGIGGWSAALRLAEWSDTRPVWTGSCPCQPFSLAGAGEGFTDERHLWPHWFHLIRAVRPNVIFGEQVEAAINHGWLDLVQDDLEGEGYSFAPVVIPAGGVGAPHIRKRIWLVADDARARLQARCCVRVGTEPRPSEGLIARQSSTDSVLAFPECFQWNRSGVAESPDGRVVGNNNNKGLEGWSSAGRTNKQSPWAPGLVDWIPCTDGVRRPVERGTFPMDYGVPNRVGRLRAYGNAVVPQVAEEVIRAYMKCRP